MKFAFLLPILATSLAFAQTRYDVASEIPEVEIPENSLVTRIADVAQYGEGDWSQVVGIARGISRSDAMWIANENPDITYYFYTKGGQMVLGTGTGDFRVFRHGDAVFFKGEPQWGEANGLADGYLKKTFSP